MLSEQALVALIRRFQAQLGLVADRTAFAFALAWEGLGQYDEADVTRFAAATSQAAAAGKMASIRLAGGFYSALGSVPAAGLDAARVPTEVPARDPFIAYWRALKNGEAWLDAVGAGRNRAGAIGGDFIHSTARQTGGLVAEETGQRVVGWRRVLTGKSCAWCATVATQRYHSADAADFGHHHCDCTAIPIYGDRDPGRVINKPVLDVLKKRGEGYWRSGFVNPDGSPAEAPT